MTVELLFYVFNVKFKHPKKIKRLAAGLLVGIFLTSLIWLIPHSLSLRTEYIFYDAFSKHASTINSDHPEDILIVDIDESALSKYGPYNEWTRDMHAKVVQKLEEGGAAAIAFDILFKNADFGNRNAVRAQKMLYGLYPGKEWRYDFDKIRQAYDYDSVLVRTIAENPNVIVCGTFSSRTDYKHQSQWMPLSTNIRARDVAAKPTFRLDQVSPLENVEPKDLLDNVFSELSHAAKNFGVANATPDEDGVLRKMRLLYRFPNPEIWPRDSSQIFPALSLVTVMHLFKTNPDSVKIKMGEFIDIGKPFGIYRDSAGTLRTTYPQISYPMIRRILQNKVSLQASVQKSEGTPKSFQEITPSILAVKDSSGNITVQTAEGDFDLDDEDLTDFDRESIEAFQKELDLLEKGKSLWLSATLDFHFDATKKRWLSNYSILSPDVLDDIFAADTNRINALKPGEEIRFGNRKRIPIDDHGDFLISFKSAYNIPSNQRTFQHISYYDVAEGRIPKESFQGKIFILGSAAPAMFDFYAAPHEDHFPAVITQATIIENILNDDYIREAFPNPILYVITAVAAIAIGLFASQYLALFFLAILFLCDIFTSYNFFMHGCYVGCTTYIIEGILAFLGSFFVRFYFESRDKNFLDKSFKQYISDDLIDEMLNSEKEPELGGEKKYLSAFFTDIQGFSTFSEQIGDPKKLVDLLNDYLTEMTDIIKDENKGTLDKYEGDAIIAFFGAPTPIEKQRRHALISALSMQRMQHLLRENWKKHKDHRNRDLPKDVHFPEIVYRMHTRIGINSGEILVGNMGSESRKNYTIMGDAVNLASRLESIGKQYGTYILVSEETLTGTQDPDDKTDYREEFITRPIDKIKVVGKSEAVQVYEVLGLESYPDAGQLKLLVSIWKKAQDFYLAQKWDEAIAEFEEAKLLEPHLQIKDPGARPTPSEVFIERCRLYKQNPPVLPGQIWDGVYSATSK
ncbi:MAG: adenylate/guanylate cyclase domain-containing protein [Fibrobacter sp.]|nr:adenylate/guanylate cyclase domain-containing protein [Fibrobacter sp.]